MRDSHYDDYMLLITIFSLAHLRLSQLGTPRGYYIRVGCRKADLCKTSTLNIR